MRRYSGCLPLTAAVLCGGLLLRCADEGDTIVTGPQATDQIRVQGQATLSLAPDIARSQLGVQTYAAALDDAIQTNSRRAAAVVAALDAAGVAATDIRTARFSVRPERDYREEGVGQIIGYWVDNTVFVTLRDLDAVGTVLAAALDAGANSVGSLVFTLEDMEAAREQVRLQAMENARSRAEALAGVAGVSLGRPLRIDELGGGVDYGRGAYDEAAADWSVPTSPGQVQVAASVEVVYAIE